jgi:uncharacterized protein
MRKPLTYYAIGLPLSSVKFEWDPAKERLNLRKHGIAFSEAQTLFTSKVDYLELFDGAHSNTEDRFVAIGPIRRGLVLIVFTERTGNTIRIISARWANKNELALYHQHLEEQQ